MGTPFCVYGPFEFDRKRINELDYRNAQWAEIDEEHYFISEAKGAYLISVRNGSNYRPLYVGVTHQVRFKGEVFNNSNLLTAIMHDVAHFYSSIERTSASTPTGWIGVMPLAVRRV